MTILDNIIANKKGELADRGVLPAPDDFDPGVPRRFKDSLTEPEGLGIIAEVKKASPSKGLIARDFDPVAIAASYQEGRARAISCLTDEKFFQGDLRFLPMIRQSVDLPILRKDFIIDHRQVDETRAWGADALLLIVAVLDNVLLSELFSHAKEIGLDCLVEVHDVSELERAMRAGVDLIGVNNRNLKDFSCSLDRTFEIKKILGDEVPLVSESGISSAKDIADLRDAGIKAALIGESLVRNSASDRVAFLRKLVDAGLDSR